MPARESRRGRKRETCRVEANKEKARRLMEEAFGKGKSKLLTNKVAVGEAFKNLAEDPRSPPHWQSDLHGSVISMVIWSNPPAWLMLQLANRVPEEDDVAILAGAVHADAD